MRILFLAPHLTQFPRRGYEVRAYHQLRLLGARHEITAVSFARHRGESGPDAPRVRSITARARGDQVLLAAAWNGLIRQQPLQVGIYDVGPMRRLLTKLLREQEFDVLHVQLSRLAGVALGALAPLLAEKGRTAPVCVLDMIDCLSLNMRRRALLDPGWMRWLAAAEAQSLRRFEADTCRRFDRVLVVAPEDGAALGNPPNLAINPCGVVCAPPSKQPLHRQPRLHFGGNLGYFPNVDAIRWFVGEILPLVHQRLPEARLVISGARPPALVRRLGRQDARIEVHADVVDMREQIHRSAVALAPIRSGSGQSLKVLEAMACGTPVVATSAAVRGIRAEHRRHLLIADSVRDFAHATVALLQQSELAHGLAREARMLVETEYTWERSVAGLEAVYEDACRERGG